MSAPRSHSRSTGSPSAASAIGSRVRRRALFSSAAVCAVAASLTACGGGSLKVDPSAFSWNAPMAAPGELHLRNMNGDINVEPATGGNVTVTAETRWHRGNPRKDVRFVTVPSGSDFTVCAVWGRGTCTDRDYNTSGNSFFRSLFRGSSGDVSVKFTVRVPSGVKVDAFGINGSVKVLATAPVRAHTVNGSITVGTSVGPVEATTVNGSVDARMTTLSGDGPVKVSTMNGTASAYLPATFDGSVHLSTMDGRVGSDFAVSGAGGTSVGTSLEGAVGKGARTVEVKSMNGNAWLRKLNADGTVAGVTASTPGSAEKP